MLYYNSYNRSRFYLLNDVGAMCESSEAGRERTDGVRDELGLDEGGSIEGRIAAHQQIHGDVGNGLDGESVGERAQNGPCWREKDAHADEAYARRQLCLSRTHDRVWHVVNRSQRVHRVQTNHA